MLKEFYNPEEASNAAKVLRDVPDLLKEADHKLGDGDILGYRALIDKARLAIVSQAGRSTGFVKGTLNFTDAVAGVISSVVLSVDEKLRR